MSKVKEHLDLLIHYSHYDTNFSNEEFSDWVGELAQLHAEHNID